MLLAMDDEDEGKGAEIRFQQIVVLPVWGQRARLWGWLPIYSLGGAAADHQGSLANELPLTHPFGPDTEALGRGQVTVADLWIIKHFKNTVGESGRALF